MKKVLIVDPLSYIGHVNYNHGVIRAIGKHYDYGIIINQQISEKLINRGIPKEKFRLVYPKCWNIVDLSKRMNKLFYHIAFRYYFIKVVLSAKRIAKNYDAVLFTCIDIYSFCLISRIMGRNCYVVDHGIGGIYNNLFYRTAWKLTSKRTGLIVLEDFIKEMASKILKNRTIYVVRHPLPETKNFDAIKIKDKNASHLVFAPSASNDDVFIQQLIHSSVPNNIRIIAKSRKFETDSANMKIYKGYLSGNEYQTYLKEADYILLAYNSTYNYRVSAVLFESICLNKHVLILEGNTLRNYKDILGEYVKIVSTPEDIFLIVTNSSKSLGIKYEALVPYSDESLGRAFHNIIG